MLFNSLEFAIFLPVFFVLYQLTRRRLSLQNTLILGASYLFYGWWDVRFLQLIVISTAVDFLAALMIARGEVDRRMRLGASLFVLSGAID
jgi:alginate O-acetyltransferase complex protein AlgI